ncbi:MAG: hypothetical protein HKN12_00320 [Gemmatimonadetes bacterium]|nr:hypothetical protein [Gemmatimonadota bacterium]
MNTSGSPDAAMPPPVLAAGAAAATRRRRVVAALPVLAALLLVPAAHATPFDDSFWKHWGDGRAEVAGYDLVYKRYGEERTGTAVSIFVTETFSEEARVKADPGRHAASDEFPVMKLNLMQDFPTGIYDYHLMTSSFITLTERLGRPAGSAAKLTFSSQEWCGHVWHQLTPEPDAVRAQMRSYFDGEADQDLTLRYPEDGILEDNLLFWARGLAAPFLEPGETVTVPLLRSVETVRLRHVPQEWETVTLERRTAPESVTVPAGTFETEVVTARTSGGRTWTLNVENAPARRLIRWNRSDGVTAQLVKSERIPYWQMNGNRFQEDLSRIGLSPRPPRTP